MGFPILYANKNQVYYIDKIKLLDDMTRHFASLGFVNGEKVKIISNLKVLQVRYLIYFGIIFLCGVHIKNTFSKLN